MHAKGTATWSNDSIFVLCNNEIFSYWTPLSYGGSYKITVVCPHVCLSVAPSIHSSFGIFLKEWFLFFCLQINIKGFFKLSFFKRFIHFRCVWPGMPKLSKITSLPFLYNILRKKWVTMLIFYMQISMKVSYKLILWFLMGMVKHSQSSQNSKFAMS